MKAVFETELSKIWGRPAGLQNFFIPRVFSKGRGRFLIQYRFSTLEKSGPRQWIFFGRVLSAEEILPAFVQRPNAFFVPGIQLIVPVFPFDPKLKILPKFFQSESSSTILGGLSQIQNLNGTARITRVKILGYRLERRSLLSLVIQEKNRIISIVAKLVRPEKRLGFLPPFGSWKIPVLINKPTTKSASRIQLPIRSKELFGWKKLMSLRYMI